MKKLIFENAGLKISAVVVALLLWFFVTSSGQSEMSIEVTPEFKNIPAGLGLVNNNAKTIVVTIRGQEKLIKSVRPSDVRISVDMERAKKGEGVYYINKDEIKLPYAMKVTTLLPSSLKVKLDERITRSLRVEPLITGSPERGYRVKSVIVEPPNIVVQGLKSEVRKISLLRTEPVDISGLRESSSQEANIETSGLNIKPDVNTVKVNIEIAGRRR